MKNNQITLVEASISDICARFFVFFDTAVKGFNGAPAV